VMIGVAWYTDPIKLVIPPCASPAVHKAGSKSLHSYIFMPNPNIRPQR
jgi:hypothetical protein